MFSFFGVPVDAAYYLVSGFTGILTPVLGGLAAVAAIIAFTMATRLLLIPLSLRALRRQSARRGRVMMSQASGAQAAPAGTGGSGLLVKVLPYLTVVIAAFAPL